MTRTGRPPKLGVSRNKNLNVRLTWQELQDIEECAKQLEKSRTDTIMYGIELIKREKKK